MGTGSSLGPIDAQLQQGGKRFSAHAFLEGFEKIKEEVRSHGQLNRAYIPMLQNISPGEIQNCENALAFGKTLVTEWLSIYKFKSWTKHTSTGNAVSDKEKKTRASEIAEALCDHSRWLTHGRSISLQDLEQMGVRITNFSTGDPDLADAISRYRTLLHMAFDSTSIFKVIETSNSQIYRHLNQGTQPAAVAVTPKSDAKQVMVEFQCAKCATKSTFQANLEAGLTQNPGTVPFPKDNIFICPSCSAQNDLTGIRAQIESQFKKKIV